MTPAHKKNTVIARFGIDASEAMRSLKAANEALNKLGHSHAVKVAADREKVARLLVLGSLPRGLKWAVDHPRVVRFYYRLRPSKRPRIYQRWIP